MPDLFKTLGDATGLGRSDLQQIWDDVKVNNARLRACAKHRFEGGEIKKLGDKYTCQNCGGTMDISRIGSYVEGYVAAGCDPNDIWPGWK